MSILTIHKDNRTEHREFTPPQRLEDILENAGFPVHRPCGGRGICGKCAVCVTGQISEPTMQETAIGQRLACQTVVLGNAEVFLPETNEFAQIQLTSSVDLHMTAPMQGKVGAAVDIGTTTIALNLYDLQTGMLIGASAMENPQRSVAADVIGRIQAAMSGKSEAMRTQVLDAVKTLFNQAGGAADSMVIVGNTTMLYLLTGRDTTCLSKAPFLADCLFDGKETLLETPTYLPPCMDSFVGADISCAVLSSGMCSHKTSLLCDIGTNGEIALWKNGILYVTATAAGPAFEGTGISCGCGSVKGAIDRVHINDDQLIIHTIGDMPPIGICGSGIIDAVAKLLEMEVMDETGAIDEDAILLSANVSLTQKDIRMVQLSKAAIAAGIQTLMEMSNTDYSEVETFYIAGGFGSHLDIDNAVTIGLIPKQLKSKVQVIGNAALAGASMLLLNETKVDDIRKIAASAKHFNLGGNPVFNSHYVEQMMFDCD